MNRESVLTAAALLAAASRLFAQDSIWIAEGLQGKAVYSLAVGQSPERSSRRRAYGAFRGTGVGSVEPRLQTPGISPEVIAVAPSNAGTVYAGGLGGPVPQHRRRQTASMRSLLLAGPMHRHRPGRALDAVRRERLQPTTPRPLPPAPCTRARMVERAGRFWIRPRWWTALPRWSSIRGGPAPSTPAPACTHDYPGYPPAPDTAHDAVIGTVDGGARWQPAAGRLGHRRSPGAGGGPSIGNGLRGNRELGVPRLERRDLRGRAGTDGRRYQRSRRRSGDSDDDLRGHEPRGGVPKPRWRLDLGADERRPFRRRDPRQLGSLHPLPRAGSRGRGAARRNGERGLRGTPGLSLAGLHAGGGDHLLPPRWPTQGHGHGADPRLAARSPGGAGARSSNRPTASAPFSFPDFTGDPAFPEVVVKMVDPGQGRGVWVFHGSLTRPPLHPERHRHGDRVRSRRTRTTRRIISAAARTHPHSSTTRTTRVSAAGTT